MRNWGVAHKRILSNIPKITENKKNFKKSEYLQTSGYDRQHKFWKRIEENVEGERENIEEEIEEPIIEKIEEQVEEEIEEEIKEEMEGEI